MVTHFFSILTPWLLFTWLFQKFLTNITVQTPVQNRDDFISDYGEETNNLLETASPQKRVSEQLLTNISFRVMNLFIAAAMAGVILAVPVQGLSLASWINSFSGNLSIPLSSIVLIKILETTLGWKFFSICDWRAGSIFGVVASLVLYPSALGLTRIDTYSWGWSSYPLISVVALITILLLWNKNGFGVLLLLTLFAFVVQLQDSTNFWDYLIDPIFAVIAFGMLFYWCSSLMYTSRE